MNTRTLLMLGWWILALLGGVPAARADVAIIVNRDNALTLDATWIANLYLGRSQDYPGGEHAVILDHPRESPLRERFFNRLNGMSLNQVNTYWARLMFSGRVLPPVALPDCREVLRHVSDNPRAIGYVDAAAVTAEVRVVLLLHE